MLTSVDGLEGQILGSVYINLYIPPYLPRHQDRGKINLPFLFHTQFQDLDPRGCMCRPRYISGTFQTKH